MFSYAFRRIPSAVAVMAAASVVIFGLMRLAKGDPAAIAAGPDASPAQVALKRHELGLDAPLIDQFSSWLHGVLTGNLGEAYITRAPIGELIRNGLGNTVELTLTAMAIAIVIGGCAGLVLGVSRRRLLRTVVSGLTALGFAVPTYVSGVLFVLLLAVAWGALPAGGHHSLLADPTIGVQYLIMPAVCLALPAAATIARFLATSVRQVFDEEYMRTGKAKGLRAHRLLLRHALPNALPPVLTILGIQVGHMLGGAIVVEAIFAWPGLGQLLKNSVLSHEYLIVQDLLLFAVGVFVVVQTLADLAHAYVDPRVRRDP